MSLFFAIVCLIVVIAVWVYDHRRPLDDTDNRADGRRSGLLIYTDYGTGYQYVKGGLFGSITPRLTGDGKQVNIYHE